METEYRIQVMTTDSQDKEIEEINDSFDLHPTDDTGEVYRRVLLQHLLDKLNSGEYTVHYIEVGKVGGGF